MKTSSLVFVSSLVFLLACGDNLSAADAAMFDAQDSMDAVLGDDARAEDARADTPTVGDVDAGGGDSGVPGSGLRFTNMPANYELFTELDFSQDVPANVNSVGSNTESGVIAGTPWSIPNAVGRFTKQVDGSAPSADGNVWMVSMPEGTYGGGPGSPTGWPFGDFGVNLGTLSDEFQQDLYVAIVSKWDSDFEWHPISNKWFELGSTNTQLYVQPAASGLWMAVANVLTGWRPLETPPTPAVSTGEWHITELLIERSTGSMNIWLDGTLLKSYAGETTSLPRESADAWQELYVRNFRGGGGDLKVRDSFIWYDHIFVGVPDPDR